MWPPVAARLGGIPVTVRSLAVARSALPGSRACSSLYPLIFQPDRESRRPGPGLAQGLLRRTGLLQAGSTARVREGTLEAESLRERGPGAEGRGAGQAAAERQASDVVLESEDLAGRPWGGWGAWGMCVPGPSCGRRPPGVGSAQESAEGGRSGCSFWIVP